MAKQAAVSIENNFTKGLITQSTYLNFPENACTETFDCIFDFTGRVSRRLGFDFEEGYSKYTATTVTNEVFTEFVWTNVAGQGEISILIQQQGNTLHYYDISDNVTPSAHKKSFTTDLTTYKATGTSLNPSDFNCHFAQGNGELLIVNPACDPIYIVYNTSSDSITATVIVIKQRDFTGLDSALATVNTRPTSTLANLISTNPQHYYNLLNQGWFIVSGGGGYASILSVWDTAFTTMPSNADYPGLYTSDINAVYTLNATLVGDRIPGTTPAPKGHFILSATNPDREQAVTDDGGSLTIPDVYLPISGGLGSIIGDLGSISLCFNAVTNTAAVNCAAKSLLGDTSFGYVGKTYSSAKRIGKAIVYGSNDHGFFQLNSGAEPSVTLTLYGKQGAAPSSSTDGTVLGTATFTDTANESAGRTINSANLTTFYDHTWVRSTYSGGGDIASFHIVAEVVFYEFVPGGTLSIAAGATEKRPTTVAFFAGRAWYAGIDAFGLNNTIFFSQIVENPNEYGLCYQHNDPTGFMTLTDLLPIDGGVIKIQEIGTVQRLFSMRTSLLVFGSNGVWMIRGTQGQSFSANDYVVEKISSVGTQSPLSIVDIRDTVMWWAEDGIFIMEYNPNYNSYTATSLSRKTIQTFFIDLPLTGKKAVKGIYDADNFIVYWLYDSTGTANPSVYDRVLIYDVTTQAFYPWTIGSGTPKVRGVSFIRDANHILTPAIKFTTTIDINGSTESLTFSESKSNTYKDWSTYAGDTETADTSQEIDYTSYFITGYKIHGQTQRLFHTPYIFCFLEPENNSSLFMQGVWDATSSGDSGKWSSKQQVYSPFIDLRNINYRRLKLRGKGRSLQLRFTSEAGKPFTLVGWSILESINQGI